MKKIMLVVALLAIVLVAAAPAIAQVTQPFRESNIKSGAASPKADMSNSGNNVNMCPTVEQDANTGNVANEQGVTQYDLTQGDLDFTGSSINIDPSTTGQCNQSISEAVAAG